MSFHSARGRGRWGSGRGWPDGVARVGEFDFPEFSREHELDLVTELANVEVMLRREREVRPVLGDMRDTVDAEVEGSPVFCVAAVRDEVEVVVGERDGDRHDAPFDGFAVYFVVGNGNFLPFLDAPRQFQRLSMTLSQSRPTSL